MTTKSIKEPITVHKIFLRFRAVTRRDLAFDLKKKKKERSKEEKKKRKLPLRVLNSK